MHILIADDDNVCRTLLSGLLDQWGFQHTSVSDGQEAWDVIRRDPSIKLVLLDWMMPNMDGYQVCEAIRKDKARSSDVYVILITGARMKDDVIKVLVAGADDYIIKPFEPLDLRIRLRAAMRIIDLQTEVGQLRQASPAGAP